MAKRSHPYPSRTRKLSSLASMVLHGRLCGRVERCQINPFKSPDKLSQLSGLFVFYTQSFYSFKGISRVPLLGSSRTRKARLYILVFNVDGNYRIGNLGEQNAARLILLKALMVTPIIRAFCVYKHYACHGIYLNLCQIFFNLYEGIFCISGLPVPFFLPHTILFRVSIQKS